MCRNIKIVTWFATVIFLLASSVVVVATEYQYDDLHRLTHVTRDDGTVTIYQYDDLGNRTAVATGSNVDTDQDGIVDSLDAFPTDPAASIDTDGDGYPDRWNDGYSQADSTTGLVLDMYPFDPNKWAREAVLGAGGLFSSVIDVYGSLSAWGQNADGQLGDGTTTGRTSPVQIGSDSDWVQVGLGEKHSLAVKPDGSLWAWGQNTYGQLGDGTTTGRTSPVQIGSDSDWTRVEAGSYYSFAIRAAGTLWAWGSNYYGQLGDGTRTTRTSPAQIGSDSDWTQVGAGTYHLLAVKFDGTLWAWGYNGAGQLGDGTTTDRYSPVQIGSDSNWTQVGAGAYHSFAIRTAGTLWAWGTNTSGQLGDGTTTVRTSPVQIGSDSDWAQVVAGYYHSLAVKSDGTLWAWGDNDYGQLGDGTTTGRTSPVQIGSDSDWTQVRAGNYHSLAIKSDGTLWGWGHNGWGQLGDGTTISQHVPTRIFVENVGSISVTLSPQGAIDSGAQWRVDGGSWQNSGATVNSLSVGSHTVEFSSISGWTAPSSQIIDVYANTTTTVQATYSPIITTGFGRITQGVAVLPVAVTLGQDFTVDFTLTETLGAPITYEYIVVAILRADGTLLFDIPQTFSNVTLAANGTWNGSVTGNILETNPAGEYRAVVRGRVANGDWFDFEVINPAVNPVSFEVVQQQTSITQITSTLENTLDSTWSLDGGRIAYRSSRGGITNIYTNNLQGDDELQITFMPSSRTAWGAVYRPNTDRIYYIDNSPTGADYHWICWTSTDGTAGRTQLWPVPGGQTISPITFSPDGSQFSFIHRQEESLYIMDANGVIQNVISGISAFGDVVWGRGANSNKLLYTKDINGLYVLYTINTDGTNDTPVSDPTFGSCRYQNWSSDGQKIVFISSNNNQIYLMNADGSNVQQVTNNEFINTLPEISPDGTTIAFTSDQGGTYDIYTLQILSSGQTILFEDDFNDGAIDTGKWTWQGSSVNELNGYLQVSADVTDAFGVISSTQISIDPTKPVIFEQRIKVHYANNYSRQFLRVLDPEDNYLFWITHYNYHYTHDCYGFGFGFTCPGDLLTPIWDQWVDEKVIYHPDTGYVEYYLNGQGPLVTTNDPLVGNVLSLQYSAWGWYTGHYMQIDSIKVYQESNVSPLNDTTAFVQQVYQDFLGRAADAGGLAYWVDAIDNQGVPRAQLVERFLNSAEFGQTVSPVTRLYFAYFNRIPDYPGLMYWIDMYSMGTPLATISNAFAGSAEFTATYGSFDNGAFVTLVYQNVLGRDPDAGGLSYWTGVLDRSEQTRGQVMIGFSESIEYQTLMTSKIYVTMTYIGLLRRSPDQGGFDYWTGVMDAGGSGLSLIEGFLSSAEYAARF